MKRQLARTRLLGIIMLGLLTIALWQFVIVPRANEPQNIAKQTTAVQAQLTAEQQRLIDLRDKAAKIDDAAATADTLSRRLPATAAYPELDQEITSIAEASGIPSNDVKISCPDVTCALTPLTDPASTSGSTTAAPTATPTAGTDAASGTATPSNGLVVYKMTLSISATGNLNQITAFSDKLHSMVRVLSVSSLEIVPSTVGTYTVNIVADAYTVNAIPAKPAVPTTSK